MKMLTEFISTVMSTSGSDLALNKRIADQGPVVYVWLFSCNDSVSVPDSRSENGFSP